MAEEKVKKPKIDLKARLGKTAVGGAPGGSAVPMPVPGSHGSNSVPGQSSVPAPGATSGRPSGVGIAPPPGMSPGIPLPPFARQAPAAQAKPVAAQQTIKVEVGEEVHEERRKASKKTAIYAVGSAVVGLAIGFIIGGQKSTADRGKTAQEGAAKLAVEVKGANDKMKELNEKLIAAGTALQEKKFPADLSKDLAAINIPFDATNLDNKNVGSLPSRILKPLLSYTTSVQDLNKTKDSLKNLLGFAQPRIEKFWKEEKDPVLAYSLTFKGGDKTVAELYPNKEPFAFSAKEWPDKYKILVPKRSPTGVTNEEKEVSRWRKGDFGDTVIPLDTRTTPALSGEEFIGRLSKAIYDIRQITEGNKESPTTETPGLLKEGEDLVDILNKAALAR